jgi:hypothetical protein
MAVKLIDLQIIYGLAGAREAFENLAFDLIKSEEPRAQKVRVSRGDGGIDAHVNDLGDPGGVHVYQCKFFPRGLEDAQKAQIRDSFKSCKESTTYRLKRWTLCLPVDLSVPERQWFETWRTNQQSSGMQIDDPWGASALENLLRQDRNKGLRDDYFKEEFVAQIGDMHGIVQRLASRVEEVLREREAERSEAKQTGEMARQAEEVSRFVGSLREAYLSRLSQAAAEKGQPSKRPAHWEVVIRPSWIPHLPRIASLRECQKAVEECRVRSNGWHYPKTTHAEEQHGQDWTGMTKVRGYDVESWRLAQKGFFAHMFPIWDDVDMMDQAPDLRGWDLTSGREPQHFLDIAVAIRTITHVFRFAARLAERAFDPCDGTVEVAVRLNGTAGRAMIRWGEPRSMERCYQAFVPALENTWKCKREVLLAGPDAFACTACTWFFERFGWQEESPDQLARMQEGIFSRH